MKHDVINKISSATVAKATGKTWDQWITLLNKVGAKNMSHRDIARMLYDKQLISSGWWCQMVTVGYEYAIGRRIVGETAATGFEIGVTKTIPLTPRAAWKKLVSPDGRKLWLGAAKQFSLKPGFGYTTAEGTHGEIRTMKSGEYVRLTWQPKQWKVPSTLQVRVTPRTTKTSRAKTASGNSAAASTVGFHHEKLASAKVRTQMRKRWQQVLTKLFVTSMVATLLAGCMSATKPLSPNHNAAIGPDETTQTTSDVVQNPEPPHPISIPALIQKNFDGRDFTVGRVLANNDVYTRYFITYKSGNLTISGIMNVPKGDGPFPVLILNHGYIDPAIYTNGRGLKREQDYLVRRGYVVVHPDYRNHAQSDKDPDAETSLRLGYTEDVINAVLAIQNAGLPYVDPERIGMMGHSMGGGVTTNVLVVRPDLVDAAILYAPVHSNYVENFNRWTRDQSPDPSYYEPNAERRERAAKIIELYGSPEENPEFWKNVSPVNFFDRITAPIVFHHGTADESVPFAWSEQTIGALRAAGKTADLIPYEGEPHEFAAAWPLFMDRVADFFDQHLNVQ